MCRWSLSPKGLRSVERRHDEGRTEPPEGVVGPLPWVPGLRRGREGDEWEESSGGTRTVTDRTESATFVTPPTDPETKPDVPKGGWGKRNEPSRAKNFLLVVKRHGKTFRRCRRGRPDTHRLPRHTGRVNDLDTL